MVNFTSSTEQRLKPVIFMAEDDEHISYLVQFLLERNGYLVETVSDGASFSVLVNENPPPDLILLDIMMPYVDGYELIRQARNRVGWENTPIIVLSALTREDDIVRAFSCGANDYVTKPFQPQELIARINRFVGKQNETASSNS